MIGIVMAMLFSVNTSFAEIACNDKYVVAELLNEAICGAAENPCSGLGVADYKELQALSDAEIKDRFSDTSEWKAIANALPHNQAGDAFARQYFELMANGAISTRNLIRDIKAFPTDYNPTLKRFSCQANVLYNEVSISQQELVVGFAVLFQSQTWTLLLQAALENNDLSVFQVSMEAAAKNADIFKHCRRDTMRFTVQPAGSNSVFSNQQFFVNVDMSENGTYDLACVKGAFRRR